MAAHIAITASARIVVSMMLCAAFLAACKTPSRTTNEAAASHDARDAKTKSPQQALQALFRAYESGQGSSIDTLVDSAMLDYAGFMDNIRDTQNQQKQIRIAIKDVQTVTEGDTAFVQLNWEKRYLTVTGMVPKLATGQATFQMKFSGGAWKLAGLKGDNVFAAQGR